MTPSPLPTPILYCGDTELTQAACYLAGVFHTQGWPFDYVPSAVPLTAAAASTPRKLIVFSDYPANRLSATAAQAIAAQVAAGAGLLMIGGWESFHGVGGDWDQSPLAELLPVEIRPTDDRVAFDQGAYLVPGPALHDLSPKFSRLPWVRRPPLIGGLNQVTPRPGSRVALWAMPQTAHWNGSSLEVVSLEPIPALVLSPPADEQAATQGRVAVLTFDVAPHWVGGLVDWGLPRVTAHAPQSVAIEVGADYVTLLAELAQWVAGGELVRSV